MRNHEYFYLDEEDINKVADNILQMHNIRNYKKYIENLYLDNYIYFSQKQLPSAWNESDWLANCRPIHIVKLRENRKGFS